MSTLMERAVTMAARAMPAAAGGDIVYQRGGELSGEIAATFGKTEFQVESAEGVRIEHTDRDFIFLMANLVVGGVLILPEKGDLITILGGPAGEVFEVLAPGGAQVYRACDPAGVLIRVHTKKVA